MTQPSEPPTPGASGPMDSNVVAIIIATSEYLYVFLCFLNWVILSEQGCQQDHPQSLIRCVFRSPYIWKYVLFCYVQTVLQLNNSWRLEMLVISSAQAVNLNA